MKKNGLTATGKQRWKCTLCSHTHIRVHERHRQEAQLNEFLDWLLTGKFQWDMDNSKGRAFRKRCAWCWTIHPHIRPTGVVCHTIMVDGTYLAHGWCLLIAIDGNTGKVQAFQWCSHETQAAYEALFTQLAPPDVLISDGLHGIERACKNQWPTTHMQRCLVHVQRNTRADLTNKPQLLAGKELKKLSDYLTHIHTQEQARNWGNALNAWYTTYKQFLNERTWAKDDPSSPRAHSHEWWWTHRDLRRCYYRLEKLFNQGKLFTYLDPHLQEGGIVPRTSNLLEGGINSLIKRTLLHHHGLSEEHMRRTCEWRCYMKSENPNPSQLLTQILTTSPTPAQPVGPVEPVEEELYDRGVQENNHDDPTSEPGFYIRKQPH